MLSPPPRVAFLGVGWIGRHRMQALVEAGVVEAVAVCDPDDACVAAALNLAPNAHRARDLDELLGLQLDGLVIATPSAMHAEQTAAALAAGCAVFCQKPLGRTAVEVRAVVAAARAGGQLLGVDFSYRYSEAACRIREQVQQGHLGHVFTADLVFHNAYGPDKAWFRDAGLSGGGCVMDLGVHLVDLALWILDVDTVTSVSSALFAQGSRLTPARQEVEDYAVATLGLEGGAVVRLACSWNLAAGQDAIIGAAFHGTEATAEMRNVAGSFFDFAAELKRGSRERFPLAAPPDDWGGRAALDWARRLAADEALDAAEAERLLLVAQVLDRIYARSAAAC